jgi:hypothetical protein
VSPEEAKADAEEELEWVVVDNDDEEREENGVEAASSSLLQCRCQNKQSCNI